MYFSLLSAVLSVHHILALDNLALLGDTLRSFQRVSCDGQTISLNCPPGTCISVQMAQYLTTAPSVCTSDSTSDINETCLWASTIQYSLLQTVVEACQKKRQCELLTSPNPYLTNLCPHRRKFMEVYYKCRPFEFRSKMACQDDVLQMNCNPNSRVAVYSASFGRVEYESVRCQQPQGVREETCLVRYATETVMGLCHGKRHCNLSASTDTFGNPCHPQSRLYLKVVYTCVPRKVLLDHYVSKILEDESLNLNYDSEVVENAEDTFREDPYPGSPNLAVAGRSHNTSNLVISTTNWSSTVSSKDNTKPDTREEMIAITIFSCVAILLSVFLLVLVRMVCRRYSFVTNPSETSEAKVPSEDMLEVNMGVDLTAITPTSAVTVLSSPSHHHCSSIEVTGFEPNSGVHIAQNRTNSNFYFG